MDRLVLLLFLLVTALLAGGHFSLEIDIENAAMRSVDTPQAEAILLREKAFGKSISLVLGLQLGSQSPAGGQELWIQQLRAEPDLRKLSEVPSSLATVRTWIAELKVPADGRYAPIAQRFERMARGGLPQGCELLIAGQPMAETVIAAELASENRTIVPIILASLLLALLLIYRSPALALGGLLPPLAGVLWVGGFQKLMGLSLDPISTLLAPTLLAIGVATSVHVLEKYRALLSSGMQRDQASRQAARKLLRPTSLTIITTVAGFLGLVSNAMPAVHRFGYLAAVGIALTCFFSLTILPVWLRCFHQGSMPRDGVRTDFQGLAQWVQRRRVVLLGVCAIVSLGMGWQWRNLSVDTDPLRVLSPQHAYRLDSDRLAQATGAVDSFEILFELASDQDPIQLMASLEQALGSDEGIQGPGGEPHRSKGGLYRWAFLLVPGGTSQREACFDRVQTVFDKHGLKRAWVSGGVVQIARDSGELVRGQLRGLAFTLACLWITMALGFRSPRLAFLGLIPNVLPCLILYGGLALVDRPLSVVSAMIGSVMLGVIVDDTIHLMDRFSLSRVRGLATGPSVIQALGDVGRPILITSVVLGLGFGCGLLGTLETTKEFAFLACSTVLFALLSDLIFLPAALFVLGGRTVLATASAGTESNEDF